MNMSVRSCGIRYRIVIAKKKKEREISKSFPDFFSFHFIYAFFILWLSIAPMIIISDFISF
jgi:hypothetical protein